MIADIPKTILFVERMRDLAIQRDDELSDSEDEGEGGRKHRQDRKRASRSPEGAGTGARSPRVMSAGAGSAGGAGRVGILDSMSMDVDTPEEGIAPSAAPLATPTAPLTSSADPVAGLEAVAATTGTGAAAEEPATVTKDEKMDVLPDVGTKNYPEAADGAVPDLNMDGPSSSLREER